MKNEMTGAYVRNGETYNFSFGTDLSTVDKVKFVNSVTDILVGDKNYNSILRDLVFDFYIVDIFTDIDTSELKESSFFVKDVEQILLDTNIAEIVKANIEDGLIDELNKAIDLNIEYRTGIHPSPLNDAIARLVNTLENKVRDTDLESMMNMAKLFTGMTEEFTTENVVNAYLASDVHKQNVIEIEKAKQRMVEIAEDMDKTIKTVGDK